MARPAETLIKAYKMFSPGLLVIRLTLATILLAHGLHDMFGVFSDSGLGPGGLDQTAARFSAMGLEPGFFVAVLASLTQLGGGLLLGLGFATRWAAAALALHFFVVAWASQRAGGFFLNWVYEGGRRHGFEYSVLLIGVLLALMLAGGGDLSLDAWRARTAESRRAARDRIRRKF